MFIAPRSYVKRSRSATPQGQRAREIPKQADVRSTKIRKGNPWLKPILIQCAWSAIKAPNYLRSKYNRICSRAGKMKAIVAVAHSMLVAIYHMLSGKQTYRDLGVDFFRKRDRQKLKESLTRRLENLGFEVDVRPRMVAVPTPGQ